MYKHSTLFVYIKVTPPFLHLCELSLLLLRVSNNSVNTFNRQKFWNFELDLNDIIFSPSSTWRNLGSLFWNIWDLPYISSNDKEIQRTNWGCLANKFFEISMRKWQGSWWKARNFILNNRSLPPKYELLLLDSGMRNFCRNLCHVKRC